MVEVWTVETVADRFVDAARTARRLPRVMVQGYASTWPIVILPSDAYPIYLPTGMNPGGIQVSPYGMLLGRPVFVSQHANTFSSAGDVLLADLSYYQTITKAGGMQTATSMHLYFDADLTAFRTTFRMDGQSKIAAPISPAKGNATLSPFVQLGAR